MAVLRLAICVAGVYAMFLVRGVPSIIPDEYTDGAT